MGNVVRDLSSGISEMPGFADYEGTIHAICYQLPLVGAEG